VLVSALVHAFTGTCYRAAHAANVCRYHGRRVPADLDPPENAYTDAIYRCGARARGNRLVAKLSGCNVKPVLGPAQQPALAVGGSTAQCSTTRCHDSCASMHGPCHGHLLLYTRSVWKQLV
jgi:hypothetical protein